METKTRTLFFLTLALLVALVAASAVRSMMETATEKVEAVVAGCAR